HCINTESGYVLLYDFDTETMKPGGVMLDPTAMDLPAYHQSENAIYWLDGNVGGNAHMTRSDVETGESTTLIPADALRMSILDLTFSGGSAIVRKFSGGISVVNEFTSVEEGITTVKLLSLSKTDGYMDNLVYILKRDHDIQLEVTTIDEDKLKLKLLAGENDFDLYVGAMQDSGTYLTNTLILDYPVYEPLENFPQIMEQMDGLFDDVVRLCSYDGHIFGVPKSFYIMNTMLSYDAELLDELGVTLPDDDWTFADFYELAKEVRSGNVYLSGSLPLSLWDYMHQYFDPYGSGTLNDDGTALREYLTLYKKLSDEDLIYSGTYSEQRELVASGELRILLGNASSDFVWKRTDVILPPSFNGERIYTVNNPYLIMNPKSQNKNAAATVIAEYLDPENRMLSMSNWGGYIYKDMSVYEPSWMRSSNWEETWDNADEERRAEMLEDQKALIAEFGTYTNDLVNMDEKTAHNFELYLDVLKYAKLGPSYVDEWLRFAAEEAEKYWNDQQDLDYTVQRIIDRAKLILDE
ncbi:MAG: extracellular solute-binding protein, partial [Clostridia bacterium]|nr:extracellular solute-binding protein [Clostridia bacterium]